VWNAENSQIMPTTVVTPHFAVQPVTKVAAQKITSHKPRTSGVKFGIEADIMAGMSGLA